MPLSIPLKLGDEAGDAKLDYYPIVALESALITHGLPYPLNLQTALEMEQEIRDAGAVPATICLLDGEIRIGMTQEELTQLAESSDPMKVSSRGLPYAVATGRTAGLTVSGTMRLALTAEIDIFATGGIGGVHHDASETGDISTDLTELSRTSIAVVCAGIKSILDIGRTLEYLETAGVPVYGYQTDEFPAFFSGSSGYPAPHRLEDASQAADVWHRQRLFALPCGAVIACPPPDAVEDAAGLGAAIDQANREAADQGISSGDVTPFVLNRVAEITDGASVRANIALLRNNARIAGEIAVAHRQLLPTND